MKPKFTDQDKYPRGYVRSEATDIRKTWAAARKRLEENRLRPDGNVHSLAKFAAARA
jgi:hypothetical protein